ncbi:MAG: PAS domain S-box protein [Nitrospirota bacterium]
MNSAQILGYPLLLLSGLELFLGLLLLKQNPRNSPVNKATAACAFAAGLWSLSSAFMYIRVSLGMDFIFFARASWIGWFTVPTALQTVLFLRDEQSRKARMTGYVLYPFWFAVLFLCLFTNLIVTDGYVPIPYSNSPGPLEMYFRTAGGLMVFWLIFEIFRLRRQVTGYRRSQLSYYLYGTIIFGTSGAVIGGFLQLFTGQGLEPSLSAYASFPWILMIFYAISRHRLFDIRLIFSRTVFILFLSFFISALQFLLFKILEPVVGAVTSIFISVPIIGVIFFATPLSRNVQQWINDLVLGGRYQYQKMLKESANAMITILHRDELLRYIVESVRNGLGVKEALLYLAGPNDVYSTRHCAEVNSDTLDGCVLPHNIVECLRDAGQPIISEELAIGAPAAGGLVETIGRIRAELILPLTSKGQMLGVLTLGKRQNGEPYLQSDIDVLQTVAGHAAVAIENAHLFEDAGKARANLRESENIFRTLAETTTAGIFILRPDRIIYANKASARLSGYGINELLTMSPWVIIHPEYRSATRERARAILQGQQVSPQNEFKFITKAGMERWALSTSAAIDLQGEPALITTLVDVTDLKMAEEERAKLYQENEKYYRERIAEQERFGAVLSTTSDGFCIVASGNRFLYVNDAWCLMLGYTRDEMLAKSILDMDVQTSPELMEQQLQNIREQGHGLIETRHKRMDGTVIDVEISVNYYRTENVFFAFIRDITERKRSERERDRMVAEKEKILKDLHDGIGGLTSNINLLAELARKNDDLQAVRNSLGTISELSRESLSEIRSFIQSLDAKELSWHAIAAEFRSLGNTIIVPHGMAFSLNAQLGKQIGGPSSTVSMNLFRIYKESLANVIKHAKASAVDVSFIVDSGRAILDIRDNGIGLDGSRVSGRGLPNMKSRAGEMGGSLAVTSDNGTRIRVELPIP